MRVLILCTGNSARSQMAEGFLRHFASEAGELHLEVFSAGTHPAAHIHPMALAAMRERQIDLEAMGQFPKSVDRYLGEAFDCVITVCDNAREACPVFHGEVRNRLHLGFEDPASVSGPPDAVLAAFRVVRDAIADAFYTFFVRTVLGSPDWQRLRMIRLAGEFFGAHLDPSQLLITPDVLERFQHIHPATVSEESNADGPIAWILLLPTAEALMREFLAGAIGETELLDRTSNTELFGAIYLCSALVLPECRGKGIARRMTVHAISRIRADHPIRSLYFWEFSGGGRKLAESIAGDVGLPLLCRPPRIP